MRILTKQIESLASQVATDLQSKEFIVPNSVYQLIGAIEGATQGGESSNDFPPRCPHCFEPMSKAIDIMTGVVSKYVYECRSKKCALKAKISIG